MRVRCRQMESFERGLAFKETAGRIYASSDAFAGAELTFAGNRQQPSG